MIFSSEQPHTGMNEGTWFTQGMCIKRKVLIVVGEGIKKCQEVILTFFMWCGIVADYSSLRKMV